MLVSKALLVTLGGHLVKGGGEESEEHVVHEDREERGDDANGNGQRDGGALVDAGANGEGDGESGRGNGLGGDGATDVNRAHEDCLERGTDDDTGLDVAHQKARNEADHERTLDHTLTENPVAAVANQHGQPGHYC